MPQHPEQGHHTKRDAETLLMLGGFISALAITVLIATAWAVRPHAMFANAAAGAILLIIGVSWVLRGWWVLKHLD
jgi:Zn-dependent protease with chaperone function